MASAGGRGAAVVRAVLRGESLWLLLFAWAVLGCFVNTRDQATWNLQHAWVESLGERGTMHVDGSATPRFAVGRLGDYWTAPDGHLYARSAPGTYLTAGAVYGLLHRCFGLSYARDFDLASTFVTFATTGLASALVFLLLYRLAKGATDSRTGGLLVAVAYSFATPAFPYSGVLYQHLTAAVFFVAAFTLAFRRRRDGDQRRLRVALEGLLLGLGLCYSFAFLPMSLAIAVYCLWPPHGRRTAFFLAGLAVGIAPLLAVNTLCFGGPFTTSYQAAHDARVAGLQLSWDAVRWRLRFYLADPTTGIFFYSPVLLVAVAGLLRFPRELRAERFAIGAGAIMSFAHLLVAGGHGDAQFGPRLLIPLLPFLALGFVSVWMRPPPGRVTTRARLAFLLLLIPSIAFCTLGAMGSTMFRDVGRWNAWYVYLHNLWPPVPEGMPRYNIAHYVFPLRAVLRWLALAAGLVAGWRLLALRGRVVSETS